MDLKLKLSLLLLVISISITGIFGFEGGDGSNDDPFQIATCEQLQNMSSNLSAYYILVDNVNCNVAPFNIGLGFEPVGTSATPFTGSLNGQNYTISNLFMDRNIVAMGLFGQINNAIISNI